MRFPKPGYPFALVLTFLTMIGASSASASLFENFYCYETGYTAKSFDLREWGDSFYVKARLFSAEGILGDNFDLMIPAKECRQEGRHLGTFRCVDEGGGNVIAGREKFHYQRFELTVEYGEAENDYKPFQEKWPRWYQRIATFTFSGGDFRKPEVRKIATNVNFYNSATPTFRESCVIDGKIIDK